MLEFVERGDIHDVASVNSRAEKWARSMAEAASVNLGGPAERLTGGSDLNHTFEIPSL
jgi:hypothetical protein